MDEQIRIYAQQCVEQAVALESSFHVIELVMNMYLQGFNFYSQIVNKTNDDVNALYELAHELAIFYFNERDYVNAERFYVSSIHSLQQMDEQDSTYRNLTERFVDLIDTYNQLFNHPAAGEAMNHAIRAFNSIKYKKLGELALGDPAVNFKPFYEYYEHNLSTPSYLTSNQFINHQQLLHEQQQDRVLLSQFDGITLGEMKELDDRLDDMISSLSVSNTLKKHTFFRYTPALKEPGDESYRASADGFLRVARTHITKGSINAGLVAYKQAIGALSRVQHRDEEDSQKIQILKEQITSIQIQLRELKGASAQEVDEEKMIIHEMTY